MSLADNASKYWKHDLDPFLIQFPDGWPLEGIRWYGLAYLAGFAVAAYLLHLYHKRGRSSLNPDQQTTLLTAIIVGTIIGGRLGYTLLYNFGEFIHNPLSIFQVWKGGMASHGGMVGILLAVIWFARKQKIRFWSVADIIVTLGPAGVLFGRIANFINAELWGKPATVAWAVIFPIKDGAGQIIGYTIPRHPSQLYEAFLEGLLLLAYTQWRYWKTNITKNHPGQLACEFLIGYGIVRILGEVFREPDEYVTLIAGLSRGSFYSAVMVIIGIGLMIWLRKEQKGSKVEQ
ncbi:prolipoprotein diacylglyceryl transferase [Rubellicoccus peritrichatus]|uniref:Phosphatidylglycerol--prolipoprotein diacylglyceryl transferase n=1 Tax=Rubellicoccus peritrichatus TaxID=3080537 RepID=A0AAQ3LC71_9BACT|nr:prolipoprotein diacylglyceryl transferase [Puniceicoccus sp. CR14]WOO41737.1 prolipoprotein diacylglyceryl transferase [Puniceicoccus sp. CR14]